MSISAIDRYKIEAANELERSIENAQREYRERLDKGRAINDQREWQAAMQRQFSICDPDIKKLSEQLLNLIYYGRTEGFTELACLKIEEHVAAIRKIINDG